MKKIALIVLLLIVIMFILNNVIVMDNIRLPLNSTTLKATLLPKDETVLSPSLKIPEASVPLTNLVVQNKGTIKLNVYNSDYVIPQNLEEQFYSAIKKYSYLDIGVYAISLLDYTCIGYNESLDVPTASAIKGPFCLFVMKQIEQGVHSLDETITYTEGYYVGGSGDIQYSKFGTVYTVEELLYKTIHISDNIAYLMLANHFGYTGYNEMVSELNFHNLHTSYNRWGNLTAEELAVVWNEIYNYSRTCDEGKYLLDLFINAEFNFIKDALGIYDKVAHKSGFNPNAYNDASIIFESSADELGNYILVVMTKPGNIGNNSQALKEISNTIDLIMKDKKDSTLKKCYPF